MQILKSLKHWMVAVTIVISSSVALAETKICLHSNYTSGLKGLSAAFTGHASISIEQDGQTTVKWGYYPDGMKYNYMTDGDLNPDMVSLYEGYYKKENPTSNPKFLQNKHCKKINAADLERAQSLVDGYQGRFGDWSSITNNCVVFAKYIYTQVTKDNMPLPLPQPAMLYTIIDMAKKQNQQDLSHVNPLEEQTTAVVH